MADRDFAILEQYECKVYGITRGRGAYICDTDKGKLLLREYNGKEEKINNRARLLEHLYGQGVKVDYYIKNRQGNYVSHASEYEAYTLSRWSSGRECDIKNLADVCNSMRGLATLHNAMENYLVEEDNEIQIARSLDKEYYKHNKELRKIRNYLNDKRRKSDFEMLATSKCQEFLEEGEKAYENLLASGYMERYNRAVETRKICHGDFNYHNIFFEDEACVIAGFEQVCINVELIDLYDFIRKLMEKYDWDIKIGYLMIQEYDKVRHLESKELNILGAMLSYPEKFWKILNYYYNANKAWIPAKNMEKLKLVVAQNRLRKEFVKTLISD